MNKKNISILTLILTIVSAIASPGMTKAEGIDTIPTSKVIYAPITSEQGITTNQLKPYVLNEKEVQTVFGSFSDEIEKLKLQRGYYVFDNEKYDIKDSNIYVMISLGQRNTTGYGIKLISTEDIEGISQITIEETKLQPDMMVGEAVTYPFIILKFAQGTPNVKVITDSGREISPLVNSAELTEKGWNELKSWEDVSENKEWLITFKKDISKEDVNSDTVYVRDSSGKKIQTELVAGEDKRTVRVIPIEKYSAGESYCLFISDKISPQKNTASKGAMYRMNFTIKGDVAAEDPIKQQANAYVVSGEFKNVPLFDGSTDKQVGTVSEGFSLNLTDVRGDKVYFSVTVEDSSKSKERSSKEYYIPVKYLEKTYKEPFITLEIISADKIKVKESASIYTIDKGIKQCIMKTSQNIGPLYYIQKTENGYQFVLGNNLVYVQPEDIELIKN
ncbi:protease complex subunit PrcB family protein [Clostridium sp. A1-XYC3]|uniref:Protease complex subunit PrcB family protein n=1 Tax=Clostridium tanneri TaxID=3037988 RepID=A0ABU4JWN1_9CLOT|nr:protease complex subunit PrcB family protein [Clostridium sp. A1-XYC3]MDW8802319.1 protease complex subunit PrcB family protein [Clostridium sp. A1-XYC3]